MTPQLLAYRGTVTKPQLVASLRRHAKLDAFAQGYYAKQNGKFTGCDVGCTLHEFAPGRESHHTLYPELFGIPTALAYLFDAIFEALPEADAKRWPLAHTLAIRPGADLSNVIPQFLSWLMLDETCGLAWTTTDAELADLAAEVGYRYAANDTEGEEATDLANRLREAWDAWDARTARAARAVLDAWAAREAWDAWDARTARAAWAVLDARDAWAARDARAAWVRASADTLLELLASAPVIKTEKVA